MKNQKRENFGGKGNQKGRHEQFTKKMLAKFTPLNMVGQEDLKILVAKANLNGGLGGEKVFGTKHGGNGGGRPKTCRKRVFGSGPNWVLSGSFCPSPPGTRKQEGGEKEG